MQSLLTKRHPLFGALVAVAFAFCSCSTIPVVVSLLNQKVRFGIVMIFLFDSPVLDPIILTLMAATLGVKKGEVEIGKKRNMREALQETFHLIKTVYPYLLLGAGIGAIIHGAVLTEWISTYMGGDKWWLVPLAAIIGIPLYIRLFTMIPISQMLIAKGMALGPVMAPMVSSAGASLPEIT